MINLTLLFIALQAIVLITLASLIYRDLKNQKDVMRSWPVLLDRFSYKADKGRDKWSFLDLFNKFLLGDCEDPVLTVFRHCFGKYGMWWQLLTRKAGIHYCTLRGVGHAVGDHEGEFFDIGNRRSTPAVELLGDGYVKAYRYGFSAVLTKLYGTAPVRVGAGVLSGLVCFEAVIIFNLITGVY